MNKVKCPKCGSTKFKVGLTQPLNEKGMRPLGVDEVDTQISEDASGEFSFDSDYAMTQLEETTRGIESILCKKRSCDGWWWSLDGLKSKISTAANIVQSHVRVILDVILEHQEAVNLIDRIEDKKFEVVVKFPEEYKVSTKIESADIVFKD